jgi:hypothetical protein
VESAIPPILLLQLADGSGHAVTAVGHAHRRPTQPFERAKALWLGKPLLRYYRSSDWVPHFYVHDDQHGIFRKLTFLEPAPEQIETDIRNTYKNTLIQVPEDEENHEWRGAELEEWHCPVALEMNDLVGDLGNNIPERIFANLWGIIAPIPKGITLSHAEAETKSAWIIRRVFDQLEMIIPDDLVIRLYLTRSNDYKQRIGADKSFNKGTSLIYRLKPMPKWIWVAELSQTNLMNVKSVKDIRIRGELILDATGNPWPTDFLAFHWVEDSGDGLIMTMTRDDRDIHEASSSGWEVKGEGFYRPLIRVSK